VVVFLINNSSNSYAKIELISCGTKIATPLLMRKLIILKKGSIVQEQQSFVEQFVIETKELGKDFDLKQSKKRVHSKGVQVVYKPTKIPEDKKFSMLPLRLFLTVEGKFETLFWVKCLYLLNKWHPFDFKGRAVKKTGVRDGVIQDMYNDKELSFVWNHIKNLDKSDKFLPKYASSSSIKGISNRLMPNLRKEDDEICVFLVEDLFDKTKATSTLVLKSLIRFHDITEYDQLVYWVKHHDLLPLYKPHLKREWMKLKP
jgi:hypothetical protein